MSGKGSASLHFHGFYDFCRTHVSQHSSFIGPLKHSRAQWLYKYVLEKLIPKIKTLIKLRYHNTFEFNGFLAFTILKIAYINHKDINIEHVSVPIFYFLSFLVFFQFCKCIDAWTFKDSNIIIVLFSAFKTKNVLLKEANKSQLNFLLIFFFNLFSSYS